MALEKSSAAVHQTAALAEVKAQFPKYFEALEQHPRMLVGAQVPAIGKEGTETLRDSADAKEWQDAIKLLLVQEIKDRAARLSEAADPTMQVLHSSIELFQKNADLVPRTKQFDPELAKRLTEFIEPYELRIEGKLHGYSIPVQPIIERLRAQLVAERAAAPAAGTAAPAAAAPAAPVAGAPAAGAPASAAAAPAAVVDGPQAGIPSKAGAGGEAENFDALFGTIGLAGLQI